MHSFIHFYGEKLPVARNRTGGGEFWRLKM